MSNNPKLEFGRFTLNHKKEKFTTFRDFAIEELKKSKSITNEKVVEECFKYFIKSLNSDYAKDDKLKKKLKVENKKSINSHHDKKPTFDSSNYTIYGVINGGPYGRDRIVSNNDDDEDSSRLGQNKAVLLYFYFFLYIPPDHNQGFYMIHSNSSDESITILFRKYVTNIFKGVNFYKATPTEYAPKTFQDEYMKGALLKRMTFKTFINDNVHSTNGVSANIPNQYDIRIEVTPRGRSLIGADAEPFLKKLSKNFFGSKKETKELEEFDETSVTFENGVTKAQKTFEWNTRDKEFVPVVYLKGRVDKKNLDGTPDFEELKKYCLTIFTDEILPEIRPDLYVEKIK